MENTNCRIIVTKEANKIMENRIIKIENGVVSIPSSAGIWMTQHEISNLFECFAGKVNANIRAILKTGVLDETNVCRTYYYKNGNFVEQYNLEMIIALSFRIKSRNTEAFRSFIMKKIVMDTSRHESLVNILWNKSTMLN